MSPAKECIGLNVVNRPLINKRKRVGASTESWGTSVFTGNSRDRTSSVWREMVRLLRKLDLHDKRAGDNPDVGSFVRKP